jgi:hypothetical protein
MIRFENKVVLWLSYHMIRIVPVFFIECFKALYRIAIIPGRQHAFLGYNGIKKHKICLYYK